MTKPTNISEVLVAYHNGFMDLAEKLQENTLEPRAYLDAVKNLRSESVAHLKRIVKEDIIGEDVDPLTYGGSRIAGQAQNALRAKQRQQLERLS